MNVLVSRGCQYVPFISNKRAFACSTRRAFGLRAREKSRRNRGEPSKKHWRKGGGEHCVSGTAAAARPHEEWRGLFDDQVRYPAAFALLDGYLPYAVAGRLNNDTPSPPVRSRRDRPGPCPISILLPRPSKTAPLTARLSSRRG